MSANGRVFFDTNILVYQFDQTAPGKQKRAKELLEKHILEEQAVISSQVVQEFINISTKKFNTKLTIQELQSIMSDLLEPLCVHTPTFEFYERALNLYAQNSLGFYDTLIIQAAIDLRCNTLYSEDLQDNQRFGTLVVRNPFV